MKHGTRQNSWLNVFGSLKWRSKPKARHRTSLKVRRQRGQLVKKQNLQYDTSPVQGKSKTRKNNDKVESIWSYSTLWDDKMRQHKRFDVT